MKRYHPRTGEIFVPHRYGDGCFRVADPQFGQKKHHARNQISVATEAELLSYVRQGLPTHFAMDDPFTPEQASTDYKSWEERPCPAPAMMNDRVGPQDTPIRKEERAIGAWLRAISSSRDFDVGGRLDKEDGYGFQTIWYHGVGGKGLAGESPFLLPGASRDNWMTGQARPVLRAPRTSRTTRRDNH